MVILRVSHLLAGRHSGSTILLPAFAEGTLYEYSKSSQDIILGLLSSRTDKQPRRAAGRIFDSLQIVDHDGPDQGLKSLPGRIHAPDTLLTRLLVSSPEFRSRTVRMLGHKPGRITTRYCQAELVHLMGAVRKTEGRYPTIFSP